MAWQIVLYFLVAAGAFALMMRFGCGAHVMGHGRKHEGSPAGAGHGPGDKARWHSPEQDVDPVCGMSIRTAQAESAVYEGHVYYFCSQACREKFEAAPTTYVKPGKSPEHEKEHHHGASC